MKTLLSILFSILLFNNVYATTPENEYLDRLDRTPGVVFPPDPFMVQKPFMCQRGDAFISVLESRKEYRAFMGQGQLVRENGEKLLVAIFTAVNMDSGTFTIFEYHIPGNVACILAIGQGFEILGDSGEGASFINVREILTLDN